MARHRSSRSGTVRRGAGFKPRAPLSRRARIQIVDTALDLIETLYVHLLLKRSMYAVNPVQQLKLLRSRCEQQKPVTAEREFFNELLSIFSQLRDLHTNFILPEPFRSSYFFLPFRLERCETASGEEAYVVTRVMSPELWGEPIDRSFQKGVIVKDWNGTPIDRVVAANADREAGSNPAARFAKGLSALTIRWLGQSLLPDEDWVDIDYLAEPDREAKSIRFQWKVFSRWRGKAGVAAATTISRAQRRNIRALGMDARGEAERQIRRFLFEDARKQTPRLDKHLYKVPKWAKEVFPAVGNARTSSGIFAYVRISTFNVESEKKYINEFIRIISKLCQKGLILDVRGNTGGLIYFGERMLQLLTPRPIDPARFSFLNSARTQALTTRHPFIRPWRNSIAQWVETGAEYSQGLPLLPLSRYNDIGQKYQGPVVLITDALCYSTTDIFAAGFQDHKIGVVLGVDETTGAGGANVWEYSFIAELLKDRKHFPGRLSRNASLRFAVRRVTRVGENSGVLLEDLGVKVDQIHKMTRRDLLHRNVNLIEHAAKILARAEIQRLTAERASSRKVRVAYRNLDFIDAYLDGRPLGRSLTVKRSKRIGHRVLPIPGNASAAGQLRLEGFRFNPQSRPALVAASRLIL
jgi:peptidase S41-like protein